MKRRDDNETKRKSGNSSTADDSEDAGSSVVDSIEIDQEMIDALLDENKGLEVIENDGEDIKGGSDVTPQDSALNVLNFVFNELYSQKKGNLNHQQSVYLAMFEAIIKQTYHDKGCMLMSVINFSQTFEQHQLSIDGFLIKLGAEYVRAINGMGPGDKGLVNEFNIGNLPMQK